MKRAMHCRHFWNDSQINAYAEQLVRADKANAIVDLPEVSGCAFFIHRKLWEELGGFDANLPDYGNESELCLRILQCGRRIVWVRGSYIHHLGRQSYGKLNEKELFRKSARAMSTLRVSIRFLGRFNRANVNSACVFCAKPTASSALVENPMKLCGRIAITCYRAWRRATGKLFSLLIAGSFAEFGSRTTIMYPLRLVGEDRIKIGSRVTIGAAIAASLVSRGQRAGNDQYRKRIEHPGRLRRVRRPRSCA